MVQGFSRMNRPLRPLPKFLIGQSPSLSQDDLLLADPWDLSNQAKMESLELSTSDLTCLYDQFQALRANERKVMEKKGLVDNENVRRRRL